MGELKGLLHTFIKSIPEDYLYVDPNDDAYGRETQPHVTILYGLDHDSDYEAIKSNPIVRRRPPIHLNLGRVISFRGTNPLYDVLAIEVNSIALTTLHYYLEMHYDNHNTFPRYRPHSTIAYVKPGMGKEFEGRWDLQGREVTADKFWFSSRDGSQKVVEIGT